MYFLIIVAAIAVYVIMTRNKFNELQQMIKNGVSDIGVQSEALDRTLDKLIDIARNGYQKEIEGIAQLTAKDKLDRLLFLGQKYPDLKGIMGTSSFDAPGVARAIQELGLVDKFFTSGTGMPADNAELLKSGVIKSLTLWDPAKSGEAMVDLACKVLAGEEIGAPVNLNVDGYTEMNFREGSETVLEGQGWITIDADNVDDFGF